MLGNFWRVCGFTEQPPPPPTTSVHTAGQSHSPWIWVIHTNKTFQPHSWHPIFSQWQLAQRQPSSIIALACIHTDISAHSASLCIAYHSEITWYYLYYCPLIKTHILPNGRASLNTHIFAIGECKQISCVRTNINYKKLPTTHISTMPAVRESQWDQWVCVLIGMPIIPGDWGDPLPI